MLLHFNVCSGGRLQSVVNLLSKCLGPDQALTWSFFLESICRTLLRFPEAGHLSHLPLTGVRHAGWTFATRGRPQARERQGPGRTDKLYRGLFRSLALQFRFASNSSFSSAVSTELGSQICVNTPA